MSLTTIDSWLTCFPTGRVFRCIWSQRGEKSECTCVRKLKKPEEPKNLNLANLSSRLQLLRLLRASRILSKPKISMVSYLADLTEVGNFTFPTTLFPASEYFYHLHTFLNLYYLQDSCLRTMGFPCWIWMMTPSFHLRWVLTKVLLIYFRIEGMMETPSKCKGNLKYSELICIARECVNQLHIIIIIISS